MFHYHGDVERKLKNAYIPLYLLFEVNYPVAVTKTYVQIVCAVNQRIYHLHVFRYGGKTMLTLSVLQRENSSAQRLTSYKRRWKMVKASSWQE